MQQCVLQLDVPIGDVHLVAVVQREDELLEEPAGLVLIQAPTAPCLKSANFPALVPNSAGDHDTAYQRAHSNRIAKSSILHRKVCIEVLHAYKFAEANPCKDHLAEWSLTDQHPEALCGCDHSGHSAVFKNECWVVWDLTLLPQTCRGLHQLRIPLQCQGTWA